MAKPLHVGSLLPETACSIQLLRLARHSIELCQGRSLLRALERSCHRLFERQEHQAAMCWWARVNVHVQQSKECQMGLGIQSQTGWSSECIPGGKPDMSNLDGVLSIGASIRRPRGLGRRLQLRGCQLGGLWLKAAAEGLCRRTRRRHRSRVSINRLQRWRGCWGWLRDEDRLWQLCPVAVSMPCVDSPTSSRQHASDVLIVWAAIGRQPTRGRSWLLSSASGRNGCALTQI